MYQWYLGGGTKRRRTCPNPKVVLFLWQWVLNHRVGRELPFSELALRAGYSRTMAYRWIGKMRRCETDSEGLLIAWQFFESAGRPGKAKFRASMAYVELTTELRRPPTPAELAPRVGVTKRRARQLCRLIEKVRAVPPAEESD